jgi:hypothetical protein
MSANQRIALEEAHVVSQHRFLEEHLHDGHDWTHLFDVALVALVQIARVGKMEAIERFA